MTSDSPWTYQGGVAHLGGPGDLATLVDETTFCLSERGGDIRGGTAQGLMLLDTRFLSSLLLWVNGESVESLGRSIDELFVGTFYGRSVSADDGPDAPLVVIRRRAVGRGLVERVSVTNHGLTSIECKVALLAQADFADLFEVKEQRATVSTVDSHEITDAEALIVGSRHGVSRSTRLRPSPGAAITHTDAGEVIQWTIDLAPQHQVEFWIEVVCCVDGVTVDPRHTHDSDPSTSIPARRLGAWRAASPRVRSDDEVLVKAVVRGTEDLGSLHLADPDHPDDAVIAAGAPWFMTLFGRDSLISSYMAMSVEPDLGLGVLRTLARLQGSVVDPTTEEQPGRILHELRFTDQASWRFCDGVRYYGTADASALFVMVLGELRRWGVDDERIGELMPAADAALRWIADYGDRDGDGYVEYLRTTPTGLANQGWKDSWDAVRFRDGRLAEGPIAMCEVQAYTYAALVARAFFAEEHGHHELFAELRHRATELRRAFNRDFWVEDDDGGYLALALDGEKRPVDAVASNMGHCLWAGIVDEDKAAIVADRLLAPDMFNGWGVRTLSSKMSAFNPVSYHNGSVWPHDNAIAVAGLMRYGFVEHAHRVVDGLLDVSDHYDGRLPELLAGADRSVLTVPAVYPTSCMPQAWAAAAPLLIVRSLLRLDPSLSHDEVWVDPALPERFGDFRLENVRMGAHRVSIDADGTVEGLPASVTVHHGPRPPLTSHHD